MTDHVSTRFPDHIEAIQELRLRDAAFNEMCADYEEISAWLADNSPLEGGPTEECDHARELIKTLEAEIRQALGVGAP